MTQRAPTSREKNTIAVIVKEFRGHMVPIGAQRLTSKEMPALSSEIKVRLKPEWKRSLEQCANSENLGVSDIARRAIHEFIARRRRRKSK